MTQHAATALPQAYEQLEDNTQRVLENSPLGTRFLEGIDRQEIQELVLELAYVWEYFESLLADIPIVQRLASGHASLPDYLNLLKNLRAQVCDGGAWLATAAAHFDEHHFYFRSKVLIHAAVEHRDFRMLDQDYQACGGDLDEIQQQPKNIGSEALSAYIYQQASKPNPIHMLGAIFIFEGLGSQKCIEWVQLLKANLMLTDDKVSFLEYHAAHDGDHYDQLRDMLSSVFVTPSHFAAIIKTAKVVARLYALQLEELNHT